MKNQNGGTQENIQGVSHTRLKNNWLCSLGAISGVFTDSASFNEVLVKEFKNVTFQSEGRFAEEPSFVIDDAAVASHRQAQERVAKLIAKINEDAES